jgi:hypothetical protein
MHSARSETGGRIGVVPALHDLAFFRIEDGHIAEHRETVDSVRIHQSFGLLSDAVKNG